MKKFKIISTCVAVLLMVALMSFGVYAMNTVSVSVSGTISFTCTEVYVELSYGLIKGAKTTTKGPYKSQPGESVTWKDSDNNNVTIGVDDAKLPELAFDEANNECTYFVTVTNKNGMPIWFNFGYKFANNTDTATNNSITATAEVYSGETKTTCTFESGVLKDALPVEANSTYTLKVTLKLSNTEYKAGGTINLAAAAALDSGKATISWN